MTSCICPGHCLINPVDCTNRDHLRAEGIRLLYRNVACEARKTAGILKNMPAVQGWT